MMMTTVHEVTVHEVMTHARVEICCTEARYSPCQGLLGHKAQNAESAWHSNFRSDCCIQSMASHASY